MKSKKTSGFLGRLIRRSLLLVVTLVLMAAVGMGLILRQILTGPSPTARDALVVKLSQSESTDWIPTVFLDSDTVAQILTEADAELYGTAQKEG